MSVDIKAIKRKLLIKYPTFGSTVANLNFKEEQKISTAATDGSEVLYNPEFLEKYSIDEQVFIFAHEVCHVVLDHIYRSEGKDKETWNIATDSVINANLKKDGLKMIEGVVDIPGAENYDAETMYEELLKEKQEQQQNERDSQENEQDEQSGDGQSKNQQQGQGENQGSHGLWEKTIENRKKEQEQGSGGSSQNESHKNEETGGKEQSKEISEKEIFEQNRKERKRQLEEMSKELASEASQQAGSQDPIESRNLSNIGKATPLIDWRRLLRQAVKYDEEYTRKNAKMRNGYFTHRLEQIPIPETEIVLDVSGSVSETLLKNFLRECKNILENSRVKVGCFDTEFHGFTEIRKMEDIDKLNFPIGGGTDFNAAVGAFSRRATNKIVFTDGEASMPRENVRNVVWVVFGDEKINPKGGKVINITGEQLRRLYQNHNRDEER